MVHETIFCIGSNSSEAKKMCYEVICLVAPLSKYHKSKSAIDMQESLSEESELHCIVNAHYGSCTTLAEFGVEGMASAMTAIPVSFFFASFAANFGQICALSFCDLIQMMYYYACWRLNFVAVVSCNRWPCTVIADVMVNPGTQKCL